MTLQEHIVVWLESNSTLKRIVAFWVKLGIEAGIMWGFPVGGIIYFITEFFSVPASSLVGFDVPYIRWIAWGISSYGAWTQVNCMLTTRSTPDE